MDPGKTKESEPKLGFSDRRFVSKAAKAGRDEVEISRIAVQRATRPEVRDFAQMVVTAHEQVNFTLTQIATAKEVKLPEASKVENWLKKKSADFDKDYIREMVDAQDNSVALFAGASRKCADQDVVAFAIKYLPTLQEHLVKAKELNKAFP